MKTPTKIYTREELLELYYSAKIPELAAFLDFYGTVVSCRTEVCYNGAWTETHWVRSRGERTECTKFVAMYDLLFEIYTKNGELKYIARVTR